MPTQFRSNDFSRGSEWRKWDLQVQTILDDRYLQLKDYYADLKLLDEGKWNTFTALVGGEENALLFDSKDYFNDSTLPKRDRCINYARNLFSYLEIYNSEVKVIGVTDHNYFDDYLIDELYNFSSKALCKVICGVEVNIGGIHLLVFFDNPPYGKTTFSDGIKAFLSKLDIDQPKRNGVLAVCQKSLIKDVIPAILEIGASYIYPHCNSNNGLFQERTKTDRTHLSDIYNLTSPILLQANSKENMDVVDAYTMSNKGLFRVRSIGTIASDSRCLKEIGLPDKNGNYLWVKADPTFKGLKQIATEPERCYIGILPSILKRVNEHPTKYIHSLTIQKTDGAKTNDIWFDDFSIPLNKELTAIIGNKGKGKSALADILGLLGNTHNYESFSFLSQQKFRKLPQNLASQFKATITWASGFSETKVLSENPTPSYEKVKYLPQNFIENLCTNIDKKIFEDELEKVIFSRLDDSEKIGKGSLKEIINYRKEIIENSISIERNNLTKLNDEIAESEHKNSYEYRNIIKEAIKQKQSELTAHKVKMPIEKLPPTSSPEISEKNKKISEDIAKLRLQIQEQLTQQQTINAEKTKLSHEVAELQILHQTFSQLHQTISQTIANSTTILAKYSINSEDIIKYSIKFTKIDEILTIKQSRLTEIDLIINNIESDGITGRIAECQGKISSLQKELDAPNREYQQYLTQKSEWTELQSQIIGNVSRDGTLEYYNSIQKFIDSDLGVQLQKLYSDRTKCARSIMKYKKDIIKIYEELYKPISDFIEKNKNEISEYNVNVDVTLRLNNFSDRFFNIVSNGNAGSFIGSGDGRIMLNKLIQPIDFDNVDSIVAFLDTINKHMHSDMRDGFEVPPDRDINKQLKGGNKDSDFYNFLYSLEYLEPNYQLRLADKTLSELSPGERGALLLIFYLLLDKDDIPIIIDQPEENLDNQSVYKILVPFIKKAKARRQIIIVTHNPNLAVVCDADQIIRADIDKANFNRFSVKAGSLENIAINAETIDVLEGTRPALNNRTSKYDIFKREAMN